jgi:hypothetical protein
MITAVVVYTVYLIIMGIIMACMIAAVVKTLKLLLG